MCSYVVKFQGMSLRLLNITYNKTERRAQSGDAPTLSRLPPCEHSKCRCICAADPSKSLHTHPSQATVHHTASLPHHALPLTKPASTNQPHHRVRLILLPSLPYCAILQSYCSCIILLCLRCCISLFSFQLYLVLSFHLTISFHFVLVFNLASSCSNFVVTAHYFSFLFLEPSQLVLSCSILLPYLM